MIEEDYINRPDGYGWYLWHAWHPVVVKHSMIPLRWLSVVWRRDLDGKDFECIPAIYRDETPDEYDRRQW